MDPPHHAPSAQCLEATRAYYVRAARPNQKAGKAAARRDEHARSAVRCHWHSTQVITQNRFPSGSLRWRCERNLQS